jgi:glycerophosphoryl diester phosphodiesterase
VLLDGAWSANRRAANSPASTRPRALPTARTTFAAERHIAVISHRGEHLSHPENTLAAHRAAIDLGADYFEADVRTTADGHFVLMHDSTVDRPTNGQGPVSKLTFAEIRKLGVRGEQVATFEEALALAKGRISIYVDAKSIFAEDLIAAIESQAMSANVVVYGGFAELKPKVIAFSRKDWRDDIDRGATGIQTGRVAELLAYLCARGLHK